MDQPTLVSFCVSTYKRPEILREQLKRILKQDYKHFEIIVSDNDPDASAKEIVNTINDPRAKYFHNPENLGMVKSFNKSLERSAGDYIVMVTDDDPVYEYMLSTLLSLKENYPNYGVYAGCGDWIVQTEQAAGSLKESVGIRSNILKAFPQGEVMVFNADEAANAYLTGVLSKSFLLWSCCIVRRDIALKVGGMPDYGSEFLTDHAYMIVTTSINGLVFINKPMGGQEVRGDNFGFDFDRLKEKYLATPSLFYNFLKQHLNKKNNWPVISKAIKDFTGRAWVEYSLIIFQNQKMKGANTQEFMGIMRKAFSQNGLTKWKYKFYLKAYNKNLFKLLLRIKRMIYK
ncbi:MAG: glycosyltransferase family 2 protein [Niabella sp.]|nr:MAG: glycosyltransferase family 2 protein [Niabella sp.]